jgi:hypothetical protein
MTERQPYSLIKRFEGFELRLYPTSHQIEVEVQGDFVRAGNLGFGPLVQYISGQNLKGKTMSMTAPVIQQPTENSHLVRFVLPESIKESEIPTPTNSRVTNVLVPSHYAAVRAVSGGWNEQKFEDQGRQLLEAVSAAGLKTKGSLYFARFDPPWKPSFLKHNEVLIQVEHKETK